jgi:RNAse (barnase) inhibitor barstar
MIKYNSDIEIIEIDGNYIANISAGINSKMELLNNLNDSLGFPYFGFNWDALWDLLNDFHWICEKKIIIVHEGIPNLTKLDLLNYISIIYDAESGWKEGEEHSLEVYFPIHNKDKVEKLIN